jgi:hypothetical protein
MSKATSETERLWSWRHARTQLERAVLTPIKAMRPDYVPLLMVYFAYGAMGLIAVAKEFWIKNSLTLTPAELAAIAVWLNVPWTVKMVFGELVDTVPVLGSRRRGYVFIGGGLIAVGMLLLWAAAAGLATGISRNAMYVAASLLTVIGLVLQDVTADAMSTEVVARVHADGTPRDKADIDRDLGMVQVLGRLALALGAFVTAGLAGWAAASLPYATVFLAGLIVPAISISGALMVNLDTPDVRPIDWTILGGGLAFGAFVVAMGLSRFAWAQEIVFVVSMAVVIWMLTRVVHDIDPATKRKVAYAAILIFLYRSAPNVGQGYTWFSIDKLGFDEIFLGTLGQIGAALALIAAWLFSDAITRQPVTRVLLWLVIAGALFALPGFGLTLGLHAWTERWLGLGPRSIALVDAAISSPLAQLGMIPMLTLVAIYAPKGSRALWFALMASLMNLAISAGDLTTKYLNLLLPVARGAYDKLPWLYGSVWLIGVCVPLLALLTLGRRVR